MSSHLTVLAPPDVQRLPAGSAGALRKALGGGELAVVPGDVATATAWWTVARSGFVRAIVEPGAGFTKVGGVGAGTGTGKRHPGQQRGKQGGKDEYAGLVLENQSVATQGAKQLGYSSRSTFTNADPTKAKMLARLLGGQ
jgi:hypothetical protein